MNTVAAIGGLVLVLMQDMVAADMAPTVSPAVPPTVAPTLAPTVVSSYAPIHDHRQYACTYEGYINNPDNTLISGVAANDISGCADKCTDGKAFMFVKTSAEATNCYCYGGDPNFIDPNDFPPCSEPVGPGWALYVYKQALQCDIHGDIPGPENMLKGTMHHFDKCPKLQQMISDGMCSNKHCAVTGREPMVCKALFEQYLGPGEDEMDLLKRSCMEYPFTASLPSTTPLPSLPPN